MRKNKKNVDAELDTSVNTSPSEGVEETYQDILAQIDAENGYTSDSDYINSFTQDNNSVFDDYTRDFDEPTSTITDSNADSEYSTYETESAITSEEVSDGFLSPVDELSENENDKKKKSKKEKVKKEKVKKEKVKKEKVKKNKKASEEVVSEEVVLDEAYSQTYENNSDIASSSDLTTSSDGVDATVIETSDIETSDIEATDIESSNTDVSKPKKKKEKKAKKEKVKNSSETALMHSINTKIAVTVFLSVVIALVITYFVTMSGFRTGIDGLVKSNMITSVKTYNTLLEDTILLTKNNLTTSTLTSLFKEAGLDGIETSQVALINEEGVYTFHRKYQLIKNKVSSQEILDLVEEHKTNKKMEPSVIQLTEDGVEKYVGYYPCANGWLLICTAEVDELYSSYYDVQQTTIIGACIILVVLAILGFVVSLTITKPIKVLTSVIHTTAELDFKPNDDLEKLCTGKDETAEMSKALKNMQLAIKDVIERIHSSSENISANANSLTGLANAVNEHSTDNSATTEELAAGMQEAAASTERVDSNITQILNAIDVISQKTKDGRQMAIDIMSKASKLKENTILASDNGKKMFANVRNETAIAIEKSKDVDKINSLTKTILEISDETNLLSLNASIEAARAGDAGRGFAVVAEQIGHLANQSATTVANIGEIVTDVRNAVNNMASCLETTLNFLEEKVLEDYNGFIGVSDEYNSDADVFEKSMLEIYDSITELEKSTSLIADAISGINSTVGEASVGVSDIAEKTSDIVELTIQTNQMVSESVECAKSLNDIVEVFKLQ